MGRMLQCKIFFIREKEREGIEKEINKWLEETENAVIHNVVQSSFDVNYTIVLTIFYSEVPSIVTMPGLAHGEIPLNKIIKNFQPAKGGNSEKQETGETKEVQPDQRPQEGPEGSGSADNRE